MKLPFGAIAGAALSLLGKTGKGKATATSIVGGGAAVTLGLLSTTDLVAIAQSVQDLLAQIAVVIASISALLFQFGIGRKAGVKLMEDTEGE